MMSEGYRKGKQKAHSSERKKSSGHITQDEEQERRPPIVPREQELQLCSPLSDHCCIMNIMCGQTSPVALYTLHI